MVPQYTEKKIFALFLISPDLLEFINSMESDVQRDENVYG